MLLTKFIAAFLAPLSLVLLTALLSVLLFVLDWRRTARAALSLSIILFILFTVEPFARWLILPLESRYDPVTQPQALKNIRWVLVLGSGASDNADAPATTRLTGVASLRLSEGLRLHHALPESTLILSGGSVFGDAPSATVMSRAAESLGADPARLRIHPNPRNTQEETELMREAVGQEPFLLVTSASHMPRAMLLARKAGLNPIPAPTAMRTATMRETSDPAFYLPSANALAMSERAIHEYLGIAWAWMRGHI
jgi:uncharacterized SAM-binding protein YcdF (DUF218 family)